MPILKVKSGKRIFISHASNDKAIAQDFIDLILNGALGVGIDEIFASTIEGTKIESGDDWRNSIKENLRTAKITFIIITPNYKESEVSLNEMGAAWVLSGKTLPVIVEPINYKTVGVIQQPNQIEKLLDEGSLDRIKDIVQRELDISNEKIASDRWTQKKKEFIKKVKKYIEENPFPVAMERKAYNDLLKVNADLNSTVENLIEEKQKLESQIEDLEKAKNPAEVKKIKEKYHPSDLLNEFEELCDDINGSLIHLSPIVRGIIYRAYNNKPLKFDSQGYQHDIEDAESNNYITVDEEDGFKVDWETTSEMRTLYTELSQLDAFMVGVLDPHFHKEYKTKYQAPLRIDNLPFWKEAFKVPILIN